MFRLDSSVRLKVAAAVAVFGLLSTGRLALAQSNSAQSNSAQSNSACQLAPGSVSVFPDMQQVQSVRPFYFDLPSTMPSTAPATAPATTTASEPDRLDLPDAPIDSPPFPMSDWTGPDPLMGTHDTNSPWPLETAIKDTKVGHFLADNRIRVYGWIDIGGNVSSSKQSNTPETYSYIPNQVVLDQGVLRFQRILDTAQTDHADWGFLFTNLYGTDYRFTAAKGYLSSQSLTHNREYGYDFPEAYFDFYLPHVAEGMAVKVGRYISPADIEAQLAPQNYIYTHSVTFNFDPYTFTGINTVTKLNKEWTVELGLHFGNDMAPWVNSAQLNGLAMLQWKNENDGFYGGLNSIGAGKYKDGHDDLQQVVAVWGHKFNETFHTQTEVYYMWMFDALMGGSVINTGSETFAAAPFNGPGSKIPGRADEVGFVNYFEIKASPTDYFTIRTDFMDDEKGQRSGYRTLYYSETIGWSHSFTPNLTIRPEIRFDHSFATPAYDNGTRKNQVTLGGDLIVWF